MWHKRLFETEITEQYKIQLVEDLKIEFKLFYTNYNDIVDEKIKFKLNQWYYSNQGQEELLRFIKNFWHFINSKSLIAMPAHDARHALFKVPVYCLKYIVVEQVQGWEKIGLIGALGHDFGRWAEEHIFGNAQPGAVHSRMSYVLLKEFLEDYNFPEEIKNILLNSVLKHTTGANIDETMPIKLTVSSDRDQLLGPEIILRILHHKPKENYVKVFFDQPSQESVIGTIIKMYFNKIPGPLFSLQEELRNLYKISLTFCMINVGLDKILEYKNQFLKGNVNEQNFKEDIEYAQNEIEKILLIDNIPLEHSLFNLLSAKNICQNVIYKQLAYDKLKTLNSEQKQILSKSLVWVNQQRQVLDQEQYTFLNNFQQQTDDQWLKWISNELITHW